MGQIYYWKGQDGLTQTSVNTLQLGINHDDRYFIGTQNNWNVAANWAIDSGQSGGYNGDYDEGGESGGNEGTPANNFLTPPTWPKAGDTVIFDKIENAFLDGASGMSGETWPYTECLYGGTTGDWKWYDGSSSAGKLEKLTIGEGYEEALFAKNRSNGTFSSRYGTGARLGINMVNGQVSTWGASGPNEGLGLWVAEFVDNAPCIRDDIHTHHWSLYDWARSRDFSTWTRIDSLYINGAGNYNFYQDELKRGCTLGYVYLNRDVDWSSFGSPYKERARFDMWGDTHQYAITGMFKDTCTKLTQTSITSRDTLPTLIVGSEERVSQYGQSPLSVQCHVGTAKLYPSNSDGCSSGSFCPATGWVNGHPQDIHSIRAISGLNAVRFTAIRDGVSGASGAGIGSINGISLGNVYMYDENPFYPNAGTAANGTGATNKNYNNVLIDMADVPANAGATIAQLFGYSGYLYPNCEGLTSDVPYRIMTGEITNKFIVQGFDYINEPWTGFEIAGHTLGIAGTHNGLVQLNNDCDIRLVLGARVSTTTSQADQNAFLQGSSVLFNQQPGGKG